MKALGPWRVELADANAFVETHHRHHDPVLNHRFSIGVGDDRLRGVAICGRPRAAAINQRGVLEVLRVATDGTRNACSWLYGAAARVAGTMGFYAGSRGRIETFTTRGGSRRWRHAWTRWRRQCDGRRPSRLRWL